MKKSMQKVELLFYFNFKCFLMQVTPALMACGQHVPAARENIRTHKLLQYLLATTTYYLHYYSYSY